MRYIKDLQVIYGSDRNADLPDSARLENWHRIPIDLNRGAGGAYVFLCKQYGDGQLTARGFVAALSIIDSGSPGPFASTDPYTRVSSIDLNKGAGGSYLYLSWTYGLQGRAILDVDIVFGDSRDEARGKIPPRWAFYDLDLNKGAGGDYVYLIYRGPAHIS